MPTIQPAIRASIISGYSELSSGIDSYSKVDAGYLSDNYLVKSASSDYFLKCYRFSDKRRIIDAHTAKYFFYSRGIPIILPIKDKTGESIQQIGEHYFSLFPFVSGCQFISGLAPAMAPKSLGGMLGRIHVAGEDGCPDISERFKPWDKDRFNEIAGIILGIIDEMKQMTDFDIRAKEALGFKMKSVHSERLEYGDMKGLRTGLIHGDYHDGNVFFDHVGDVTHVFDLEKTCVAPFVFEIIRAIQYSNTTGYNRSGSEGLVKSFLDGYTQERAMSDRELDDGLELFYQNEIHGLWVEKEHYLRGNTRIDRLLHTKEFLEGLDSLRSKSRRS